MPGPLPSSVDLFCQCRDQSPDQVGGELAGLGAVELVHEAVEAVGIRQAVALANVGAEHFAEAVALVGGEIGREGAGGAELGKLAALAEVEDVTPDLAAGGLGLTVGGGIGPVEGFEVRG